MEVYKSPLFQDAARQMTQGMEAVQIIAAVMANLEHLTGSDLIKLTAPILEICDEHYKSPRTSIAVLGTLLAFLWDQYGGQAIARISRGEAPK